ncbi:MAG: type II secretion system F family protein [Chlamydiia bacterium]|nr:type II secretion system F family protein [Chlamydiia bacterium]
MALYQYWALDKKGKKNEGTIDADSLAEAKWKLLQSQIAVIQIAPLAAKQIKTGLSRTELLHLTRELARLLQAGLPLFESLSALEEKYQKQKPHRLLLDLADRIRSGESFSSALAHHADCFHVLYIAMVSNAEKTGKLAEALEELAAWIGRQLKLRKQMISTLLYPALLATFCFVVLGALLFYVVPSLRELFEGRELHPFTQIVFSASAFACRAKGWLALFALLCIALCFGVYLLPRWKNGVLAKLYRMPGISPIFAKIAFVRFCRASATLLEGGVPALSAFPQARRVMRHPALERVIAGAEQKLMQGEPFYAGLEGHPLIPSLVPRMIAIAEQGGRLPFMMSQIAHIYEEELEASFSHFTALAQPLLLLLLGAIVGFVLLSVLLPLTDVSSFAT